MLNKKFLKFAIIIPALAGLCLMTSIPAFSTKTNDENTGLVDENEISIDKKIHDFGTIKEADGDVSATFTITNNTKAPIVLSNVVPSCGCTSPSWTKEPIKPGKKGEVVATYSTKGHIGQFDKTVTITITGEGDKTEKIITRIRGTVE
jgi:hypothetical protein